MSDLMIVAALVTWWTFAVVALATALAVANTKADPKEMIAFAVFWPVTTPVVLCVFLYSTFVWSGKMIRTDLRNRQLLKEFDEFLAQRRADGGKDE